MRPPTWYSNRRRRSDHMGIAGSRTNRWPSRFKAVLEVKPRLAVDRARSAHQSLPVINRVTGLPKLRLPVSRIAPLLFLSLAVGASPANGFIGGMVAYERDTPVFYYPLFTWAAQQLHAGHFPLWLPEILGGYPLFADAEIGLAAPQVLLALVTLPTDVAFVVLRLLHALVAALGAYALARAWRLPRAPATLVGLTFTLGSFLQAHVH